MILLIIANVCNWVVAVIGLKYPDKDFATHLLIIFMANTTLYTLFYIIMKVNVVQSPRDVNEHFEFSSCAIRNGSDCRPRYSSR